MSNKPFTLAHVTHEAVEQLGGIGAVLEGLMISPVYKENVGRSILVGPCSPHMQLQPGARLGDHAEVLYSSADGIDKANLSLKFRPVEWAFGTSIVYGKRWYERSVEGRSGEAEILLIDVFGINQDRMNVFKARMFERFGLDSMRHQWLWDFEEYARLAEPAFYALLALLDESELPCVLFSHEFMGMPAALQAISEGHRQFRTVFHAHECSTARRIVEDHPGHDTMFYNVLKQAMAEGKYVEDVFGKQDHYFRHMLISRSHLCDGVIAVGDHTAEELKFLDYRFDDQPIDLVYNGIPVTQVTLEEKFAARKQLIEYSESLLGWKPDVLMTHVTRPVISKGLWRDLAVCHELDRHLGEAGQKGVLYILTTAGGTRRAQDVARMSESYNWPEKHRDGYPDLVGPEVDISRDCDAFNESHQNVQAVLVNQFGWSPNRIGTKVPAGMTFDDFRCATDVEFGMATYEPFGISPLEPLCAGAICVTSNVCGCNGFVKHATRGRGSRNVITADFTQLDRQWSVDELLDMGNSERDQIERRVAREVADQIWETLPTTDRQREKLIEAGQKLVQKMGWDQVVEDGLLPMLERIRKMPASADARDISG